MKLRAALLMLAAVVTTSWSPLAAAQEPCRFVLGFATLRELVGAQKVGACLEDEHFNLENGNAEQRTSGGMLVWRKVDNFTAFTDGGTTWVNGPNGLQSRPNGERFSWERDPVQTAQAQSAPAPAAQAAPPPQPQAAAAPAAPAPVPRMAPTATPRPVRVAPTPTPRPPSEEPIKLSGDRDENTRPFTLRGGNYTVEWETQLRRDASSCYSGATLYRVEGRRYVESLYSLTLKRDDERSADGETQVYDLAAGQYYLDVGTTGCSWTVEIRPQ